MDDIKDKIISILKKETKLKEIQLESPPKPEMGDYAFPCFMLSKEWKKSPKDIAEEINEKIKGKLGSSVSSEVIGPYVNFFIDQMVMSEAIIKQVQKEKEDYGRQKGKKEVVLIESPGPNTNKPLHLGHLRNILLASSIANALESQGKDIHMINIVNDRGVHICKSMLAYQKFGKNQTPEKVKIKSDHFVGDFYVKYSKEEKKNPKIEEGVQELLIKWEEGDKETKELWKKMNKWALDGFKETYKRLGFSIEKEYLESESYTHGKEIVLTGLKKKKFTKNKEGAVVVDLAANKLDTKVLLRANGTSVYITQDLYVAKKRYEDYKFDKLVYVVGNEQEYHFKVLFAIFEKLKWKFADKCHHFSYGMVELPEGKMKSREGSVVDTDDLIEEMKELAKKEVKKRYKDIKADEVSKRAEAISMAAIRFFFLKFDPKKNFVFNPKESLSFEGDTGPYVQYSYARICSIFKKLGKKVDLAKVDYSLLKTPLDRRLLKAISSFPDVIEDAANQYKPSLICHYLTDLASTFNEYYRDNVVLKEKAEVRDARLALIDSVRTVIKSGLALLDIDVLEQM